MLVAGESASKLIKRSHLGIMKQGAVIVDVAIDQGGSTETSRPTTHDKRLEEHGGKKRFIVKKVEKTVY